MSKSKCQMNVKAQRPKSPWNNGTMEYWNDGKSVSQNSGQIFNLDKREKKSGVRSQPR